MRKGQTEMIGLVVIVVLLMIGALFYVRFGILDKEKPKEESTVRVTQAYNLMNALINLQLCEDKSLGDALAQCKEEQNKIFCKEQTACDFVKQEVPHILDPILHETIGVEYSFEAKKGEEVYLSFGRCETGINSPPFRFPESKPRYQAFFKLCPLQNT